MLKEIAKSITAASPLTAALGEANRMARRYLQQGGAAMADGADRYRPGGFVVPLDIDHVSMESAIAAKFRSQRDRSHPAAGAVLELVDGGRVVVPSAIVRRLGGGDDQHGRHSLERIIADIRHRRMLQAIKFQSEGRADANL